MKSCFFSIQPLKLLAIALISIPGLAGRCDAQVAQGNYLKLSLAEAVQIAQQQNKWVQSSLLDQVASEEDLKDIYQAALPSVMANGSVQRYSDLTQFTDGLSQSTTGPRKPTPNAAALGIEGLLPIYSGGKQKALQLEQKSRLNLAGITVQDLKGNIALQTASQYLTLVRLTALRKLSIEQLKRAQTRLETINSLYRNEKVTRSDVLRAEVMLANVELFLQQTENDITIANEKLSVLMNLPETAQISPVDSAGMAKPELGSLIPLMEGAGISSFSVQSAAEKVETQAAKLKGILSLNAPALSFYTAYGINYPNNLFFPPVDQAYSIGFVGLKVQYNISSLYFNKHKVAAARQKVTSLQLQQQATSDNVKTEVKSYYVKYGEALARIAVNNRSVEQARVNYRIINTKYLNQLALLTDLLDADNLFQETQFNLIKAQTDALIVYYNLRYASGTL
jgi:outer membrane protein